MCWVRIIPLSLVSEVQIKQNKVGKTDTVLFGWNSPRMDDELEVFKQKLGILIKTKAFG